MSRMKEHVRQLNEERAMNMTVPEKHKDPADEFIEAQLNRQTSGLYERNTVHALMRVAWAEARIRSLDEHIKSLRGIQEMTR